ncbi:MAG: threonylcarbamoyl-AMP synthase [Actinobacteria bacterium]|nr:MAG: threonylcarbamoyl-AMP synthase [Actinomycetota bacterium]
MNPLNSGTEACQILRATDSDAEERAIHILASGGLVAIPTETVYGLAADMTNAQSIAKIFAVKGRPDDHPLIVHIATKDQLNRVARDIPSQAYLLAAECWPGPLTLLLLRGRDVSPTITGQRDTVAVRVPANTFTRNLISNFGQPLAAPSANRFGRVSPTNAQHVCSDLGSDVDLIIDDGPCLIGVESTIVDFTVDPPQLLRPGGIPVEDLEMILGRPLQPSSGMSRASGMLQSHYQPQCTVVLASDAMHAVSLATSVEGDKSVVRILDRSNDLPLYAATLYDQLRQADQDGITMLVAVLPPPTGLGLAIADRLTKAAGPTNRA